MPLEHTLQAAVFEDGHVLPHFTNHRHSLITPNRTIATKNWFLSVRPQHLPPTEHRPDYAILSPWHLKMAEVTIARTPRQKVQVLYVICFCIFYLAVLLRPPLSLLARVLFKKHFQCPIVPHRKDPIRSQYDYLKRVSRIYSLSVDAGLEFGR